MKVKVTENFSETSQYTADMIADTVLKNSKANLGLATGRTALSVYDPLIERFNQGDLSFKDVHTINLDEYVGMNPSNKNSYRSQMDNNLFNHIDIKIENTYCPNGLHDVNDEIETFKSMLESYPRDLQLLGVGGNGHIGFNEPRSEGLNSGVHMVDLDEKTIETNSLYFEGDTSLVPKQSITMGIGDILKAEKIVLIATGHEKAWAIEKLLKDDLITPKIPCTFLKTHKDVTIIIDKELYNELGTNADIV